MDRLPRILAHGRDSIAFGQAAPATPPSEARDCDVCPELALVPPGQFLIGSAPDAHELDPASGESPAVPLSFTRPFLMSRREITVGEFRRFAEATGAKSVPDVASVGASGCKTTPHLAARDLRRRRATTSR